MTNYSKGIITFTNIEKKYAELITKGWSNYQIADLFKVSLSTVKHNVTRILVKTGTTNRVGLVASFVGNNYTLVGSTKRLVEVANKLFLP